MKKKAVIALYAHIEAYPPSLNALHLLAPQFDEIYVLVRNILVSKWQYPSNVILVTHGNFIEAEKLYSLSFFKKLCSFISFGFKLRSILRQHRPSLVLVYDPPAFTLLNLFSGKLLQRLNILSWYHNHDVFHESELPRYSLMWITRKLEQHYFSRVTYFSLPNTARLVYFPVDKLKHTPVILPNYPSVYYYGQFKDTRAMDSAWRIIFQGHISKSNGIDSLVDILTSTIQGRKLELHLAGPIDDEYRNSLIEVARTLKVDTQIFFYGRLPYATLPELTASCHIGVAIYGVHNTMVRTMSTASNKIFEYASVSLPVLINDRSDMKQEFLGYEWIHFTKLDKESLLMCLERITKNYLVYSAAAKSDFEEKLNFEASFNPWLTTLIKQLKN